VIFHRAIKKFLLCEMLETSKNPHPKKDTRKPLLVLFQQNHFMRISIPYDYATHIIGYAKHNLNNNVNDKCIGPIFSRHGLVGNDALLYLKRSQAIITHVCR
jgi:hypothetical protein